MLDERGGEAHALQLRKRNVVGLEDAMYYRKLLAHNLVHHNIPRLIPRTRGISEKKQVPTIECRFHRPTVPIQAREVRVRAKGASNDTCLNTTTIGDSVLATRPRPIQTIYIGIMKDMTLRDSRRVCVLNSSEVFRTKGQTVWRIPTCRKLGVFIALSESENIVIQI